MPWSISLPDTALAAAIRYKIDTKTKPLGALGRLEPLAEQVALVQQTLTPQLCRPHILVFAADHGIAQAGVSQYPPEVTHQMVRNFAAGGAAINVFCRQNGLNLSIVDAGVRGSFADLPAVRNEKIAEGTRNFTYEPAMSVSQCTDALQRGARLADELHATGCNVLGLGEMGIGNTSSAAVLMHRLTGHPLAGCVGRGTGLNETGLARKLTTLTQAVAAHPTVGDDPLAVLATFGGFEIAQMCGVLLRAAEHGMLLLIDGFIASAALLVAARLAPSVLAYCVFCHESNEQGHRLLLAELGGQPLLHLDLRLGEGTGCALAYPLVQAAVNLLNEMASFESAGVSDNSGT
ncbi:nicotinate-nucleotide--dimethylbenzimidazole phosphoribosyltransferase [Hymenobacter terrenus]|uniref:nicotinate-nucleotide--dimethylbenzimidazole phosphoribosyltransferase n=1 Tax=Hymenobacter terrenus TaxID=1629124 RepID=UPI000619D175|nr:nicotinate-nucleotide--dimethylbenzimidazole phosphoribosyltransferase [Hymenobacter terrenus]